MASYPYNGSPASAVFTSYFLSTYNSCVSFTPQNVRRYSSTPSNIFNQSWVFTVGVVTEPSVVYSSISRLPESFCTPVNVTFLKVVSLETLYLCLMNYTAISKLLSDLVFTRIHGSGAPVAMKLPGRRKTLHIVLTDSSSSDLNSPIDLMTWSLYIDDDSALFQPRHVSIALQATRSVLVAIGHI